MTRFFPLLILLVLCGGGLYAQQTVTAEVAATEATFTVPADPEVTKLRQDVTTLQQDRDALQAAIAQLTAQLDQLRKDHELTKQKLVKLGQVEILPVTAPPIKLQSVMQ